MMDAPEDEFEEMADQPPSQPAGHVTVTCRAFGLSKSGIAQIRDAVTWARTKPTTPESARRELDRREMAQ